MYKLIFKGRDIDPIFIDDEKGKQVWQAWVDNKQARMVLGNTAFYSGDIKQITKVVKTEAETARVVDKEEKQYLDFREKMLSLSLEKRANIMRIANMVWKSHTKDEMPENIKAEIKARQLAYFKENPKCIYANPKIYKDLIPKLKMQREIDNTKPIGNLVATSMMRLLENIVQTDLQYSIK